METQGSTLFPARDPGYFTCAVGSGAFFFLDELIFRVSALPVAKTSRRITAFYGTDRGALVGRYR